MFTIKQTCGRLAIGRTHLWNLIRAGKIRTVRIGKRSIRVPQSEIDRFIREGLLECQWMQEAKSGGR